MSLTLRAAHDALERGDRTAAFVALLTAWQGDPDPALAEIIERLSPRAPPIAGKTTAVRDAEFERRLALRDPIDLPAMLDHALERRQSAIVPARLVGELATWPRDPRSTKPLIAALAAPSWDSATANGMWDAIFELLAHHADPRAMTALAALEFATIWRGGQFGGVHATAVRGMERRRAKVLARFAPIESTLDPAAIAELATRTEAPRSVQALIDAVLEHPDRSDARDVLRDALLEAGDPRGEHMALDVVARTRSLAVAEVERRNALARDTCWWPGLEQVAGLPVVRDGFLVECSIAATRMHLIEATIGAPAWSTVERIDLMYWTIDLPLALFAHPVMRSLRALGNVAFETAPQIWTAPWLRSLEIAHLKPAWGALMDRADALPNLARLETSQYYDRVNDYGWLWETALFRRLRELTVGLGNDTLGPWYRAVAGAKHAHLARIELGRFHFERDAAGHLSRATVTLPATPRAKPHTKLIAQSLGELPARALTEIRFVGRAIDRKQRAVLEAGLASQAIERFVCDSD